MAIKKDTRVISTTYSVNPVARALQKLVRAL